MSASTPSARSAATRKWAPRTSRPSSRSTPDSEGLLRLALSELNLSARAYDRILKVSRTIADLAGAEKVDATHLSEAIQYRTLDRQVWG
jgi:magnesium chelatase family protein